MQQAQVHAFYHSSETLLKRLPRGMPQNSRKATGTLLTVSPDQRSKIKGHADESGAKLEAGSWKLEAGNWKR